MANSELLNVIEQGEQSFDEWRAKDPSPNLDLSSADLRGTDFRGWNLSNVDFSHSTLTSVAFAGANLDHAKFQLAKMAGAVFSASEQGSASLINVDFRGADVTNGIFEDCVLRHSVFVDAKLSKANFRRVNIQNVSFNEADLSGADFRGAQANSGTTMEKATVTQTVIDRYTLEQMEDYGKLTKGERMTLVINDDVATLRQSFGGFVFFIHLTTILLFLAPYVWFLTRCYARAQFGENDGGDPTVLGALLRYMLSGGKSWYGPWIFSWNFVLVVWATTYVTIRMVLMWKTKSLELAEATTGLPPLFSLTNQRFLSVQWKYWYLFARFGFWANLLAILLHSYRFLSMKVPIAVLAG